MSSNDMFNDMLEMAKSKEGIEELVALYMHIKQEFMPALGVMQTTVGKDADNLVDEIIKYGARKTAVMYNSYREVGFSKDEALALTIGTKASLGEAMRHAK